MLCRDDIVVEDRTYVAGGTYAISPDLWERMGPGQQRAFVRGASAADDAPRNRAITTEAIRHG